MNRETILNSMNESIKNGRPIIGACVGAGFPAKQAVEGGADFIMILSAGKFRIAGISSIASFMPFANSNEIVFNIGEREVLTKNLNKPIIFGAYTSDVNISQDELLYRIIKSGFDGVTNFPTVGIIDGKFREYIEENGCGFETDVNFMEKAVEKGLFTIAFVFDEEQGIKMAQVGVDIICVGLGWTVGGQNGISAKTSMDEDIEKVNSIFNEVDKVNKSVLKMVYGGRINNPDIASYFYDNTSVIGYIGGSGFERIPSEKAIKSTTSQFKNYYLLKNENRRLRKTLIKKRNFNEMIGESLCMHSLYELIEKISAKHVNVLIYGESGTGKELVVRSIHYNSERYDKPFIKINCASIPKDILESELFGHEKGAFTGADKRRIGRFELAHKGTLFLDEIGDMDLSIQAKLLRIIQYQEFERVGGNNTIKVDVRIICATNKDLKDLVRKGKFREDLYYRLNTIIINIPPLRKRKEDIPLLVNYFLKEKSKKFKKDIPSITNEAFKKIIDYEWPGNVRELEHCIERAIILEEDGVIDVDNVFSNPLNNSNKEYDESSTYIKETLNKNVIEFMEKQMIYEALIKNKWNRTKTSEYLGISRRTLYNKIKKYGIYQ